MSVLLPTQEPERAPSAPPVPSADAGTPTVEAEVAAVDAALRGAALAARPAGYLFLWLVAPPAVLYHLLAGALLADYLVWVTSLAFGRRVFDRLFAIEVGAALLIAVWLTNCWSPPHELEHRVEFCLGCFAALIGRIGVLAARRRGGCGDDGW
ncbi:MAG: hypothetical protein IPK26_31180 [Planctomycetes bacterium]|nr:hypothetical protein [Planctomycetota bacterium]